MDREVKEADVAEEASHWNKTAGRAWVETQDLVDELFKPIEEALVESVPAGGRVLDVGCGTGATTVAVAGRSESTGIDVSEPMVEAARARAERAGVAARFVRADAEDHAFEPGSFDTVMSRFGVMFFGDPVRAFANLRRATRDGGALRLVVWRDAEENPFMTTAERAAAPLVPNIPERRPDAPGQFAFADADRVRGILGDGGWGDVEVRPADVECVMPEKELVTYITRFGPLGLVMHEVDEAAREEVVETVRAAFGPFVHGDEVRFTAALWTIAARAV
ncbi:class I SAM-dependent methyltransferase [Actinomadura algeriensis]|uniref:SAM-dependent methyltransferase n=1 Tax=Actinomadura algeriensis TaxID=1679523 RepID=A0ABR9JWT3_9ACTN|nr:class I SAM-dependent methyltransferase [Actinomadura algeriensis]MBE1535043.1 SAM-dependent methyltransferase [Actinomadura algeriensis]